RGSIDVWARHAGAVKPAKLYLLSTPSLALWCRCWRGKERRAHPEKPVGQQSGPFAHGCVGPSQTFADARKRTQSVNRPGLAPVDRIRLDRKARFAKDADRPRHMIGRGYQQPALARLRPRQILGEDCVLERVTRTVLEQDPPAWNAEAFEQPQSEIGLGAF